MQRSTEDIYDELLVYRCQDGERDAFDELFSRWNGRLLAHAVRQTGRADGAADALQDAWLSIVRGISRLDDPARFRGWAYRIVSNKCADAARRGVRRRGSLKALGEATSPEQAPVDRELAAEDDILALRAALRDLPAERRAILSMHYLDAMPVAEIASVLAIPEGTVKSRLHHARAHLKRALEQRSS